ncbi:MAG: SAM-dependent chlorinase/fluorinase, partial [Actinomycetota bacterium]|nr:SAM-dependent chlorinase/fluorinase [Actinomycetota bacterium]
WGTDNVRTARQAPAYGDLKAGEVGVVVDSYGLVSLALDRRSAAEELRLRPGDAVTLEAPS